MKEALATSELEWLKHEVHVLRKHLNVEIKHRQLLEEKVIRLEQKGFQQAFRTNASIVNSNASGSNLVSEFI